MWPALSSSLHPHRPRDTQLHTQSSLLGIPTELYNELVPPQVKKSLEALKQRQEEEEAHLRTTLPKASQEKWETEEREATAELLKLKDRLIDVEKNVRLGMAEGAAGLG